MICKLGICVAYDWELLQYSLPAIYEHVDAICLSIDSKKQTWSGGYFEVNEERMQLFIERIDHSKKIKFLSEPFYDSSKTPIENECYQRKRMAEFLGEADWIIQIDTDEIFLNANDFIKLLRKYKKKKRPVNVNGLWVNLIKQTPKGFIYSILKTPPLATNFPIYHYGRTNGHFNVYTNTFIGHITWARPEDEVYYKLKNWGHSHEFNGESFFKIWQALDDFNIRYVKDFHHMSEKSIPVLHFQEAASIEEFIENFDGAKFQLGYNQRIQNNIWYSRLKKLISKFK